MNSINCDTSWKISLFMDYRDNEECVLKGVRIMFYFSLCLVTLNMLCEYSSYSLLMEVMWKGYVIVY